jgi:hypothetical protein
MYMYMYMYMYIDKMPTEQEILILI